MNQRTNEWYFTLSDRISKMTDVELRSCITDMRSLQYVAETRLKELEQDRHIQERIDELRAYVVDGKFTATNLEELQKESARVQETACVLIVNRLGDMSPGERREAVDRLRAVARDPQTKPSSVDFMHKVIDLAERAERKNLYDIR